MPGHHCCPCRQVHQPTTPPPHTHHRAHMHTRHVHPPRALLSPSASYEEHPFELPSPSKFRDAALCVLAFARLFFRPLLGSGSSNVAISPPEASPSYACGDSKTITRAIPTRPWEQRSSAGSAAAVGRRVGSGTSACRGLAAALCLFVGIISEGHGEWSAKSGMYFVSKMVVHTEKKGDKAKD